MSTPIGPFRKTTKANDRLAEVHPYHGISEEERAAKDSPGAKSLQVRRWKLEVRNGLVQAVEDPDCPLCP